MRKLRKTGALDQEGNLITIPRLPSVTGTNKPPRWNRWSAAEKVEHLLGISLDRMREYLSWPADDLDPYRLAAQTQVIRVVAMVGAKVGDQARREREGIKGGSRWFYSLPQFFSPPLLRIKPTRPDNDVASMPFSGSVV
jgi:hypothetical protein